MLGGIDYDYSEVETHISQIKDTCIDTNCLRNLINFLEEQVELLEDECYERERDLDTFAGEDY